MKGGRRKSVGRKRNATETENSCCCIFVSELVEHKDR